MCLAASLLFLSLIFQKRISPWKTYPSHPLLSFSLSLIFFHWPSVLLSLFISASFFSPLHLSVSVPVILKILSRAVFLVADPRLSLQKHSLWMVHYERALRFSNGLSFSYLTIPKVFFSDEFKNVRLSLKIVFFFFFFLLFYVVNSVPCWQICE